MLPCETEIESLATWYTMHGRLRHDALSGLVVWYRHMRGAEASVALAPPTAAALPTQRSSGSPARSGVPVDVLPRRKQRGCLGRGAARRVERHQRHPRPPVPCRSLEGQCVPLSARGVPLEYPYLHGRWWQQAVGLARQISATVRRTVRRTLPACGALQRAHPNARRAVDIAPARMQALHRAHPRAAAQHRRVRRLDVRHRQDRERALQPMVSPMPHAARKNAARASHAWQRMRPVTPGGRGWRAHSAACGLRHGPRAERPPLHHGLLRNHCERPDRLRRSLSHLHGAARAWSSAPLTSGTLREYNRTPPSVPSSRLHTSHHRGRVAALVLSTKRTSAGTRASTRSSSIS